MMNVFFEDEEIKENDLYFICYIIERIARTLHTRNRDVVNAIGYDELVKKISLANVLDCDIYGYRFDSSEVAVKLRK